MLDSVFSQLISKKPIILSGSQFVTPSVKWRSPTGWHLPRSLRSPEAWTLGLEGPKRSSHQPTPWQRHPAACWSQSREGPEQGFGRGIQQPAGHRAGRGRSRDLALDGRMRGAVQRHLISVLLPRGLVRAAPSASFAHSSVALSLSHKVFLLSLLHPLASPPSAYPNSEREPGRAAGRGGYRGSCDHSLALILMRHLQASSSLWLSEAEGTVFFSIKN